MKKARNIILLVAIFVVVSNVNAYAATAGDALTQPEKGWRRYDETDSKIIYSDTLYRDDKGLDLRYNNTLSTANKISFNFYGTKLRIIGVSWDGNNLTSAAKIKIDDLPIDYFYQNVGNTNQCINYEKTNLPLGNHKVTLTHDDRVILDAIDIDEDGYLSQIQTLPTLEVKTSDYDVKVGHEFSTDVVLNNVNDIYAEDFTLSYDKDLFQYIGYEETEGLKVVKNIDNDGIIRFIVASKGKENDIDNIKIILKLNFRALKAGEGKVDATKARIANLESEWDIEENNCGDVTINVEGVLDVNRSGEFTLLDLAIDSYYYDKLVENTDTEKYDADVINDGTINDDDLRAIVSEMLSNANYEPNR